ncbi:glycoside hydrolase family 35 protein [Occallatibacter riparius]|uniref:Beta-galactosidase n=1 Tax=Occallatibacter riparius TaxID=1002689 RepID=A0A9J7BGI6_9BACT|nr:beta-galactosidase family protein [Occallatibacter riparius]UWZ82092.1 beta-galactosidase [Occallatibacter riparius]
MSTAFVKAMMGTALLSGVVALNCGVLAQAPRTLPVTIEGDHFVRDGKPYQIISGAIHYPRVPREYWRDRLQKARAMGLNTVETYVFWNLHEPQPGVFDFSGQLDVAAFIRMAQEEGLNVIVRPGPYVCAEWEAGGFPAWLFADPAVKVRTLDAKYLEAADRYLMRVGKELAGLQVSRGGPIIAVQIENEYGSFGQDKMYMEHVHQTLIKAGLGEGLMYTSDGADQLPNDALPGVLAVINFGPGEAQNDFAKLAKLRPGQPRMTGEYWDGWFDSWGNKQHAHTDAEQQAKEVDWILSQGNSINLYMFHGGTTFGFMNGANFDAGPNGHYYPQTTSYDYDAALDEAGRPTKKFFLLRDVIQKHTGVAPPPLPPELPMATVPEFALNESASLWDNLPKPIDADAPKPMEAVGQTYGYILYRTQITGPAKGDLNLGEVRDFATVYVDQKLAGTADRMKKQTSVALDVPAGKHVLDLLVENTGRVNFGARLTDGRAGIIDPVTLGGRALTGWKIYSLPMGSSDQIQHWGTTGSAARGPWFHRGSFTLDKVADTYLDTSALAKGFVWVNGHNVGRVWDIGPQRSLFVPAPWLRAGKNDVVVFDYAELPAPIKLRGVAEPVWSAKQAGNAAAQ